jgi:hypothetical protein
MSLANHFNKKAVSRDRLDREITTFEDFRTARIRQSDGSHGIYRAGKLIGREDAPNQSKFHMPTTVSTIVAEEPVEKDSAARVRKPFDVNAKALKL